MGDLQLRLIIKDDGTAVIEKVTGSVKKMEQSVTSGGASMKGTLEQLKANWVTVAASVYAAERALSQTWAMAKRGAEFEESTERLNRQLVSFGTNASAMANKLADLVGGQLSLEEATRLSSKALAAGFNPAQIETMTRMAEVLSDLTGGDVAQGFDTINQALITGRDTALKSLGIHIDLDEEVKRVAASFGLEAAALSEAEKFQIRLNAVMREAPELLAKYETAGKSHADELTAMEKEWDNLTLAVSRWAKTIVVEAVGALKAYGAARAGLGANAPPSLDQKIAGAHAASTGGMGAAPAAAGGKPGGLSPSVIASLNEKAAKASGEAWAKQQEELRAAEAHNLTVHHGNVQQRMQAENEAALAMESANLNRLDHELAAYDRAEEALGRFTQDKLNREYQASLQVKSFWTMQLEAIQQSAAFAWASITTQFSGAIAQMIVFGGQLEQALKSIAATILQAVIQTGIQMAVNWAMQETAKTAATTAEATARTGIVMAETAASKGAAAVGIAQVGAVGVAALAVLTVIVQAVSAALYAMAAAVSPIPVVGQALAGAFIVGATSLEIAGMAAVVAGTAALAGAVGAAAKTVAATSLTPAAEGLFVTGPTPVLMGEAGPEVALPLDRAREFLGGEQTIILQLDGREIGRKVVTDFPALLRFRGVPV